MAKTNVSSEVAGTVWELSVKVGDKVAKGDALVVMESMKMEIPVESPEDGIVVEIRVNKGDPVEEEQVVAVVES